VGKARVFLNSQQPIGVFTCGEMNLHSIIEADISWKDASDGIWKSGRHAQYRGQMPISGLVS